MSSHGVIAAGHRLTAEAGADVLRRDGSAYDAVIAALAMGCVCEPVLCSPGGGGFAMVREGATGSVRIIDFFPQTPLTRRTVRDGVWEVMADFGTALQAFHIGPATAATPGFFHGLARLHESGGTMPLGALFAPAVAAARAGITISDFQHHLHDVVAAILTGTPGAADLFAPGGSVLGPGATFRNPGLADALESMADAGFTAGAVGRACVDVQAGRGHLVADDLEQYEAIERSPLTVTVGDHIVHLNPLPAAGGALVAHSLDHLESTDPVDVARALGATGHARTQADGDLAALATVPLRQRGTTHISVIDSTGTACAVTVSNGEGNGELVGDFGFMLNNVLGEEDVNPAGPEDWPTGTRLSSMMCPTIIEGPAGAVTALGSGGSNRIRSAICQVLVHLCLDGRDLRDAVESPRLHVEGDHLDFEDHFAAPTRDELFRVFPDHRAWPEPDIFYGGVHTVRRRADGTLGGVGDRRRGGAAIVVD
jgi:gamma-glutamyltranspeptidase/glutathione hydrolase